MGLICAVQPLASQGVALRGHNDEEAHFRALLLYTGKLCPQPATWLSRPKKVRKSDRPTTQYELTELMYRTFLKIFSRKTQLSSC
jgi:hypothetical protein